MRVPKIIAALLCLPHCFASDADARATATSPEIPLEVQTVQQEQKQAFESLFPKASFDAKAFPYLLGAPVAGKGVYAGVTSAGPFSLTVHQAFPVEISVLPLAATLQEGAMLHGLQLTGALATIATPAARVEVYGMVVTQASVAGWTKFLLGGILSAVQSQLPSADPSLCSCSRESYPCSDFNRGFDPWLCDSQEFDNYQASMVSACVAFQRAAWDAEQRYKTHVAASMNDFAKRLVETAAGSWQSWLADGASTRPAILSAAASLRAHLLGCEMVKADTLGKAAATLRAIQESVRRDFLDKAELARKN